MVKETKNHDKTDDLQSTPQGGSVAASAVGARIARPGRIDLYHVPADGQWPPLRR